MNGVVETADELRRGREAYASRAWLDAYTALSEADRIAPLAAADLDLLANSASLVGRMDEYLALLERAHLAHIEEGDNLAAARSAGWLGMTLAIQREIGPASGWFARAERLVEREGRDCVERGWLLIPVMFQREAAGDYDGAFEAGGQAVEIAESFDDPDLAAIALHAQGLSSDHAGVDRRGPEAPRRGDGRGHGRPGVADRRGHRLLRRDRGLRGWRSSYAERRSGRAR